MLDFVVDKIFGAAGPKGIELGLGPAVTMRADVEAAIPYVEMNFKQQPLVEAELHWTIGGIMHLTKQAGLGIMTVGQ